MIQVVVLWIIAFIFTVICIPVYINRKIKTKEKEWNKEWNKEEIKNKLYNVYKHELSVDNRKWYVQMPGGKLSFNKKEDAENFTKNFKSPDQVIPWSGGIKKLIITRGGELEITDPVYYKIILGDYKKILDQVTDNDYVFITIPTWADQGCLGVKITDDKSKVDTCGFEFITMSDQQIRDIFIIKE